MNKPEEKTIIIGQLLECTEVVLPTREIGKANLGEWNLTIFRLMLDERIFEQHIASIVKHIIRMTGCKKDNIKGRLNAQCDLEVYWKLTEEDVSEDYNE